MRIVTEFDREVRDVENLTIPLADGCRLAAHIWLPVDAEADPVPAILEYLPYRKRDGTSQRDALNHPYIAGHGYACVRVDMRGNGESDGLMLDEYAPQEQDDALEVIAWLARQPWCTGAVGMIGISWGGFNGLQVAARRPDALKAVVTLCSTDDRYADDIHFMGGCLLNDNLGWASTMFAYSSRPPDPALLGEAWRARWLERLENTVLLVGMWLRHQRRDDQWRHGSVCEDFAAIRCPVYAIGGWADGYSNAVPRLLAGLRVPCKGLIGPWAHKYPHFATPGPRIGFLQETLRWWDQWLKGRDTGIMDEPAYRVWMQDSAPPEAQPAERPGRWVAEPVWPSPNIRTRVWTLAPGRLLIGGEADVEPADIPVRTPQYHGVAAGSWCAYGLNADIARDQRVDDGLAVCFDTAPLGERLEILGAPVATLMVSADRPVASLCARLCDVAPDGTSLRVSYGLLNLMHRDGHAEPEPMEPGRRCSIRVQLNDAAHAFPPGHRIRLALSTTYWPIAWPAPEPATVTLGTGGSRLDLPVRPRRPSEDEALRPFPPPEAAPAERRILLEPGHVERRFDYDVLSDTMSYVSVIDSGRERIDAIGLELREVSRKVYRIRGGDPLSAENLVHWTTWRGRGDWQVRVETRTRMRATREAFLIDAELDAYEGNDRVFRRDWHEVVPRDLV
jgi:putative CocE/NonD family hydrolase